MNVFFDNCTSPVLATTLHGYIAHRGHAAHHIRALPCGPHAPDLVWIEMLSQSAQAWIVITGDGRIQRNKAERAAYRNASLKGFVLAPSYQKLPLNQTAALLVWRWPDIERLAASVAAPALFQLPVNRAAAFRQLPM